MPGADTNPYFTVAAALAVGRPALPKKFEPNEPVFGYGYGFGKVPENLMFPRIMPEAMAAFHKSNFAR